MTYVHICAYICKLLEKKHTKRLVATYGRFVLVMFKWKIYMYIYNPGAENTMI